MGRLDAMMKNLKDTDCFYRYSRNKMIVFLLAQCEDCYRCDRWQDA